MRRQYMTVSYQEGRTEETVWKLGVKPTMSMIRPLTAYDDDGMPTDNFTYSVYVRFVDTKDNRPLTTWHESDYVP